MKKLVNLPKFSYTRRPGIIKRRSQHKACWRAQSSLIHLSTMIDQHSALFAHQFGGT